VHVNGHGEFQIFKQGAAGNVVCGVCPPQSVRERAQMAPLKVWGVPTPERTRACPDGALEGMGGVGIRSTELYKPVFLPEERERWRWDVGLVEESAGSDGESRLMRIGVFREEWKLI